ncbi:MAG: sulfotransferase [Deltaproteobacteria bacterium]|nr:sulfotransferase [Deltaproteobacteria bacterium]
MSESAAGPQLLPLLCTSYSGSTLVGLLASASPQLCFTSQLSDLSLDARSGAHPCGCGAPIAQCGFWREVAVRAGAADPAAWIATAVTHPAAASRTPESGIGRLARLAAGLAPRLGLIGAAAGRASPRHAALLRAAAEIRRVAECAGEVAGARVVLDATKYPEIVGAHIGAVADLRLVYLVRDPRGVVASRMRRRGETAEQAARVVLGHALRHRALLAALPEDRRLVLRYEAVCAAPEREINRLLAFAGLDPLPAGALRRVRKGEAHVVGGNPMRFDLEQDRVALDQRWREQLTAADLATIRRWLPERIWLAAARSDA